RPSRWAARILRWGAQCSHDDTRIIPKRASDQAGLGWAGLGWAISKRICSAAQIHVRQFLNERHSRSAEVRTSDQLAAWKAKTQPFSSHERRPLLRQQLRSHWRINVCKGAQARDANARATRALSAFMSCPMLPPNIVVLVHGNNGAPNDFDAVEAALRKHYGADELLIIKSAGNHTITFQGVEQGGTNLADEVTSKIFDHDLDPNVTTYKFSMIAHSLGGLYCRYALAKLMKTLRIINMEFVSFVTLCSPHMGSRRPRAESALKNIWRMGVHKVLASRQLYGETGLDLLIDPPESEVVAGTEVKRPVLEMLCDPQLPFITALKAFRFCTLVALADGDLMVPYASAAIRNFNPYPSNAITESHPEWRWHVRHSGFAVSCGSFLKHLESKVDPKMQVENFKMGLDVGTSPRYTSEDCYDCDNKREVEFKFEMMQNLQRAVPWRRIDLLLEPGSVKGKMSLHDWPINKCQVPDSRADEFIELLCEMIGSDHHMDVDATASTCC
ncbi:TPA: hypothetical protein N0F65_000334, partial [Lagenidium giganteum]